MPSTNEALGLFVRAGLTSTPANIPLHTHGAAESSGSPYAVMTLFIAEGASSTGKNDNIALFIKQTDAPTAELTLYTQGKTVETIESNTVPLFIQQGAGPSDTLNLYVKGLGVTSHSQSGLTESDGFNFYSQSIPLTIQREYEATTVTTTLFIEGQQTRTLTDSMPLNILAPEGMSNASLELFLNSSQPSGTLNLYTRGY